MIGAKILPVGAPKLWGSSSVVKYIRQAADISGLTSDIRYVRPDIFKPVNQLMT